MYIYSHDPFLIVSTSVMDGNIDPRFVTDPTATLHWKNICDSLQISSSSLVFADQQHGLEIAQITSPCLDPFTRQTSPRGIDAMITNIPNIYLVIVTADCLPVFFYDTTARVVGIAHCGWKGVLGMLAVQVLQKLQDIYQCSLSDIHIMVGPSIHDCCYRVDRAVDHRIDHFVQQWGTQIVHDGYLSLHTALQQQLLSQGVPDAHIAIAPECTACNTKYFSYYRDASKLGGQQAHLIGIPQ